MVENKMIVTMNIACPGVRKSPYLQVRRSVQFRSVELSQCRLTGRALGLETKDMALALLPIC